MYSDTKVRLNAVTERERQQFAQYLAQDQSVPIQLRRLRPLCPPLQDRASMWTAITAVLRELFPVAAVYNNAQASVPVRPAVQLLLQAPVRYAPQDKLNTSVSIHNALNCV